MNYPDPSILILSGLIRFVKAPPKNFQKIGKQYLCGYQRISADHACELILIHGVGVRMLPHHETAGNTRVSELQASGQAA